jgi:hypothetical protein
MDFTQLAPINLLPQKQRSSPNTLMHTQLTPTHCCSKCAVKYISLVPFMKEGKQLRMCIYCRIKKKEWRAKGKKVKVSSLYSFRPQKSLPEEIFLKFASNSDDYSPISFTDVDLEFRNVHPPIVEYGRSPKSMSIINLVE